MKFPDLLPPGDLLKQVEGIESGLRQRKRLGLIGLLATLAQVVFLVAKYEWFLKLFAGGGVWPFIGLAILVVVVLSIGFTLWARFWIKESQEPFRYTYSIADFKPVLGDKAEGPQEDPLSFQMSHDLSERLNQRIKRLSLLDEADVKPDKSKASDETKPEADTAKRKSHIHIQGNYVIRLKPEGQWFIEVMPRVRIGPSGSPETLAHPVKFKLPKTDFDGREQGAAKEKQTGTETLALGTGKMPPRMTARQYEQILERVYFSVATEIYKQIQEDVKRKIDLLPTDYFRAVALFHEAEDYANSNTLDAYKAALNLYDQALTYFDPEWRPLPKFFLWRRFAVEYRYHLKLWSRLKGRATVVWSRLGRVQLMCARAEIGYANMLLYRRALAALSGQRVNASFDASRVASRAVERVRGLSEGVENRESTLFNAYVTLALAWLYLRSNRAAEESLNEARALNPVYAEMNPRYLFVSGELEPQMRSKLHMFRHAVELDPRFEVAQFSLANQVEQLWRTRPSLERGVAEAVLREYDHVLKLNPGNIGAWARQGYICWLLALGEANVQKAQEAFEDGREYKEIKRETFVAELDYGLARIAAEKGNFATAYRHYSSAVSAHLAQGIKYGGESGGLSSYQIINETLLGRIVRFKETVEDYFQLWAVKDHNQRWQSRTFPQVVADLEIEEKRETALRGIRALLKSVSAEQRNNLPGDIDLDSLAKSLRHPLTKKTIGQLRSAALADQIGKYLPTLRVRKSVYAFVLTQYGEACNNYYLRSGNSSWERKAWAAFAEARELNPHYVIPRFLLCQSQMNPESPEHEEKLVDELETIVDIEPEWPAGILALTKARARFARTKSRLAQDAKKKSENATAEKDRLELSMKKLRAEKAAAPEPSEVADTGLLTPIEDPRIVGRGKPQEIAARPEELSGGRARLETAIDKLQRIAKDAETRAAELKKDEISLARGAVEGIRKLLPFKWAESALDEELEQSGREHRQPERDNAGQTNERLATAPVWNNSIADEAVTGTSSLLENTEIAWEKQMEDTHVRALQTWGEIRPFLSGIRDDRRVKGRVVLRGEEILCHIRRHFWPDDFELHLMLRDLEKSIFDWKAALGNHKQRLAEFLASLWDAKWLKSATMQRDPNDESIIILRKNARTVMLKLDEGRSRVCLILKIAVKEEGDRRLLRFSEKTVDWDDIPGSHEKRFKELLCRSLGANWLKKARIKKSEDGWTIRLSDSGHSLSLKLDRLDGRLVVITHEFKLEKVENVVRDVRYFEYRETSNEVISDAIHRDWKADRCAYFILTWVIDASIEANTRRRILTTVSTEVGLASSLYRWLGDQWFRESIAAIEEFKKAAVAVKRATAAIKEFNNTDASSEESKKKAIEEVEANRELAESSLKMAGDNIRWAVSVYDKAMDASNGE